MVQSLRTLDDVACTACGCVCDDLTITIDGDRIVGVKNGCVLADPWFLSQIDTLPAAAIDGQPVATEAAVQRAAEILAAAKSPLIYGLSRSTTEGQRAAIALAERLGATIDTPAHGPSILAMQQVGECTCTLGEVKSRADLVIFWGCDPITTHPRLFERYLPATRHVVAIDSEETATAREANEFLQIDEAKNWDTLWTLRLILAGKAKDCDPRLTALAECMKACKFGVVFFGSGLGHRTVEALLQLVTDLNDHTRFYARHLRRGVTGAESVLTWQTGYPFSVNFAAGYPRYNPGEFTGPDMLARGEIDACLLLGNDSFDDLKRIPVIRIGSVCDPDCAVSFMTAVYGIHTPGTACRMDDVSIPLKVLLPTKHPSDTEVIKGILARIESAILNKPAAPARAKAPPME